MYQTVLTIHSFIRWLVLLSLVYSVVRAYRGWLLKKTFSGHDNSVRHWTATIAHCQLLAGLLLYSVSPVTGIFLHQFKNAVHQREIRFLEWSTVP